MNTTHSLDNTGHAFKLGIVGGIGPAATVDFMSKIIRNTDARCDQEHLRLVVEHNPQIPDRTANLLGGGEDPTQALYDACKRLEANEATPYRAAVQHGACLYRAHSAPAVRTHREHAARNRRPYRAALD